MNYTRLAVTLMTAFPLLAAASGYHVGTQSTSNQGVANSGAAGVFDASTVFYNPAGLARLKGTRFTGVFTYAIPDAEFTPGNSTINAGGAQLPLNGNDGGTFVDSTLIPHLYFSTQLNKNLTFGVGAFVPFGSKTNYDENWVGRYNIVSTELVTMAINPSLGWRINDSFSLGAGVSAQYMSGKLSRHVNFGGAGLPVVAGSTSIDNADKPAASAALLDMYGNAAYDGKVNIEGTDWSYGFNLGVMWDITPTTRMGMAFRSAVRHTLSGDADWTTGPAMGQPGSLSEGIQTRLVQAGIDPQIAAGIGGFAQTAVESKYTDSGALVDVDTPESFSINGYSELSKRWALMADFTWTGHSRFKELRVDFASTVPDSITVEDWDDSTRWSLGTVFQASDKLKLRAGFALDMSPVDDHNRTASIPDNTRTWYSAGMSYAFTADTIVDVAYTYVNVKGSTISHYDDGGGDPNCACSYATLKGSYKLHSHLLGMQFNMAF